MSDSMIIGGVVVFYMMIMLGVGFYSKHMISTTRTSWWPADAWDQS